MILSADGLRCFRRRTWAMIAACLVLRATAAFAGLDPAAEPITFASACTVHPETLSC
jgi:hypothetical protein